MTRQIYNVLSIDTHADPQILAFDDFSDALREYQKQIKDAFGRYGNLTTQIHENPREHTAQTLCGSLVIHIMPTSFKSRDCDGY